MSATAAASGTDAYVERLRAALADLPPTELADVVDEARAHLDEVARELPAPATDAALAARLGAPEAYADELRAAAGYPPRSAPGAPGPSPWPSAVLLAAAVVLAFAAGWPVLDGALGGTVALLIAAALLAGLSLAAGRPGRDGLAGAPRLPGWSALRPLWSAADESRGLAGALRTLQPAWWVVRALAAAVIAAYLVMGGLVLLVVAGLAAVAGSVWLGRAAQRDRRWLWAALPGNALAVPIVLTLVALVPGRFEDLGLDGSVSESTAPPGLSQDGLPVLNVFPVDERGEPLEGVYLVDQDGRPLTVPYAGCRSEPVQQFPAPIVEYDDVTGRCTERAARPPLVAVPDASAEDEPSSAPPS